MMSNRRVERLSPDGFLFRIRNGLLWMCVIELTGATLFVGLLWDDLRMPQTSLWVITLWALVAMRALIIRRREPRSGNSTWRPCGVVLAGTAASAVLWASACLLVGPESSAIAQVTATLAATAIACAACGFLPGGGLSVAAYILPTAVGAIGAMFLPLALPNQVAMLALVFLVVAILVEIWTQRLIADSTLLSEQLLQAKRAAEKASAVKSSIIANTSHELRTPLNAVIGFSEAIAQEILGPVGNAKYVDYARSIQESGKHLLQIINDILDMSRIESGKYEMNESYVPVCDVAEFAMRMMRETAANAGVTICNQVGPEAPRLVADERMLKQIVLNLLSNAVKFTPMGGTVTLSSGPAEGEYWIAVEDSGIGIPAEDIERVFEPFVQIEGAFNRRHQGTGLGLALVRAMVELHQARLNLESELGRGTIAKVCFPLSRVIHKSTSSQELACVG